MSNEKNLSLFTVIIGDEILPNYIGIIISHHKDAYSSTRIQSKVRPFFFFFVAQVGWILWFPEFP